MAGYSATPLAKKLGVKEGTALSLVHAPAGVIGDLPSGVSVKRRTGSRCDVAVAFFCKEASLHREIAALGEMIFPDGGLWIAWPKKTSGVTSDMTDEVIRRVALPLGLVDNKVCAIDGTWSGLRLVWRRQNRGR